ncbi:nucleotide pyrophosphohydrolase [Vibrio phage VPMS1]|uniref:nucleotide pyrophosphohydrolase n=1 Tax=Vibrio phage VPMS1 TaxID=1233488 RepID=UPI000358620E|nr:nucleotide pyrophosphohydrolase [Vibrio phage VPMS1]AFV51114.1 DNA repair protein NTP-PPase [Vibrio phage VPMS1]
MHRVFPRVISWNQKRYPQEYNHHLTLDLLKEEFQEWLEALTEVDKLDALCDIIYVALGALWKADVSEEANAVAEHHANEVFSRLIENTYEPHYAYFISMHLTVLEYEAEYPVATGLHMIIKAAFTEMLAMRLTYEQCIAALLIVCDSNDSKSVKKTDPAVKANAGDKGPYFVSPEPRLQALLDKREALN